MKDNFELDHLEVVATSKSGLAVKISGEKVHEIISFIQELASSDEELLGITYTSQIQVGMVVESIVDSAGGYSGPWGESGTRGVVESFDNGCVKVRNITGSVYCSLSFFPSEIMEEMKRFKS